MSAEYKPDLNDKDEQEPYLITASIKAVFGFLSAVSPYRLGRYLPWLQKAEAGRVLFGSRQQAHPQSSAPSRAVARQRALRIEAYIAIWLGIEVLFAILATVQVKLGPISWVLVALSTIRILDIFQSAVNISVFDPHKFGHGDKVASVERMIVLSGVNFLELILCFGAIYAMFPAQINAHPAPILGYYLSAITQLTIGYGDLFPLSWLKLVAVIQGIINFIFVTLTISRFISSLRPMAAIREQPGQSPAPPPSGAPPDGS